MKKTLLSVIAILAFFAMSCTKSIGGNPGKINSGSSQTKVWENSYSSGNLYYTSMKLVDDLAGNVSSISPTIDDNDIPSGTAADYLKDDGCLSSLGPLGAYGPLGTLGAIGDSTWNVSYWVSAWGSWSDWYDSIDGPLGPSGPLGEDGPVSDYYYNGSAYDGTNDWNIHSRALGVWAPLGAIGPLGALGALGPLGPVGALGGEGLSANSDGEYVDSSNTVHRTITIDYDAAQTEQRTYELYEKYDEAFAEAKNDNDTSFMVTGVSSSYSDEDVYEFTSGENQLVTIVVVNEKELDDFDLTILDENDNVIATSNEGRYFVDWVQLKVPANTTLKAKVKCYWSGHVLSSSYRLYVTGSTANLNKTEITGNHISNWQ